MISRSVRTTANLIRILAVVTFLIVVGGAVLKIMGYFGGINEDFSTYVAETVMSVLPVVFTFALTYLPEILNDRRIYLPPSFQMIILLFVFGANFLGDFLGFYYLFPWWDKILHTLSGIILGLIGFLLVYVMNQSRGSGLKLSPSFIALFTFTFAIAAGACWEIVEFFSDSFLGTNMQRWESIPIMPMIGNLEQGIGLLDTMNDLIVDAVGGIIAAMAGFIYLKKRDEVLAASEEMKAKGFYRIYQDMLDYAQEQFKEAKKAARKAARKAVKKD